MDRTILTRVAVAAVSALLAVSVLGAAPAAAQARHHITLGPGFTKMLSSDLKNDAMGIDFTNAANGNLAYRFSMNEMFDLTIDAFGLISQDSYQGVDLTLQSSFFGPGVRWHPSQATPRPYLQANVFLVDEEADAEQGGIKVSTSDSSAGFGVSGGVDIPLNTLLSLPIGVHYLYGKPADDISGFGGNISIAFNWGVLP